jgi:hypothetical protein
MIDLLDEKKLTKKKKHEIRKILLAKQKVRKYYLPRKYYSMNKKRKN